MLLNADSTNGIIELDNIPLHGVLQSLSVNGDIIIDTSNSSSNQASLKSMRGYKDKMVSVTLRLVESEIVNEDDIPITISIYQKLTELEQIFKEKDQGTPKIYKIFNPHIIARGVDKVILTSLSSSEDNSTNTINVTLNFEEFIPASYIQ